MKKHFINEVSYYTVHTPVLPFRLMGKWNFRKKVKTTHIINPLTKESIAEKLELVVEKK